MCLPCQSPPSPLLLLLHGESKKDLERDHPTPTPRKKKTKHVGKGVQGRWPGQPRGAVLSHAEEPATARTLQPRPEVEGKHGSVPGRRLPRAAA